MVLNEQAWERELQELLERHDEFDGYSLELAESFADMLVFRVMDFDGDIGSGVWSDVAEFGSVLEMKIGSAPMQSRRKVVTFQVTEPSDNVLMNLAHYSRQQYAILDSATWRPQVILAMFIVSLLAVAHSSHLLHEHWHETERPWEGLFHWLVASAAYLYPFAASDARVD